MSAANLPPPLPAPAAPRASEKIYTGVWSFLVRWFRVPAEPPSLPVSPGEHVESFKPSANYLKMLKALFWIAALVLDIAILIAWIIVTAIEPWIGVVLIIPALALAILPDIVAYVAMHLRYDTMWYVLTDRSLRIRRGIWSITETTLTFENVQNVSVRQGPVQRYFGIADVIVETAGSGSPAPGAHTAGLNRGIIEGVADAPRIRDMILARVRQSRSAGLGDDGPEIHHAADAGHHRIHRTSFGPAHVAALREILAELRSLRS